MLHTLQRQRLRESFHHSSHRHVACSLTVEWARLVRTQGCAPDITFTHPECPLRRAEIQDAFVTTGVRNDGSASARGEAPPIVAFPTPPAIKTDPRPNVAARRSALMV